LQPKKQEKATYQRTVVQDQVAIHHSRAVPKRSTKDNFLKASCMSKCLRRNNKWENISCLNKKIPIFLDLGTTIKIFLISNHCMKGSKYLTISSKTTEIDLINLSNHLPSYKAGKVQHPALTMLALLSIKLIKSSSICPPLCLSPNV